MRIERKREHSERGKDSSESGNGWRESGIKSWGRGRRRTRIKRK